MTGERPQDAVPETPEPMEEVWGELDEHLDTLNQNTAEIAAVYEYLDELDATLGKLSERVDALQALLLAQTREAPRRARDETRAVRLTAKEEAILQALLAAVEPVTSAQLARRTGLTPDLAAQLLFCVTQKGVPVQAHTMGEQTFYALAAGFREEQQRSNSE